MDKSRTKLKFKIPHFVILNTLCLLIIVTYPTPGRSDFNHTQVLLQSNPYLAEQQLEEYRNFTEGIQNGLGIAPAPSVSPSPPSPSPSAKTEETNNSNNKRKINYPVQSSLRSSWPPTTTVVTRDPEGRTLGENTNTEESRNANLNSLIGVTSVLAIVHENIWYALRLPAESFSRALRSAPASLSGLMGMLFKSSEEDYNTKIRNIIFTPTWVKTTMNLINLKSEVKQAYFEYPEKAMETVNRVISTRYGGSFNLPEYLTEPLPDSTESLIINAKEQRGIWPDTSNYVGSFYQYKSLPNNNRNSRSGTWTDPETEAVDMFDIFGNFEYGLNEQFQFVTVPFQRTKLRVTLIVPNEENSNLDFTPEQLEKLDLPQSTSCPMRIRLPIKTFVSRNSVKLTNATDSCTGSSSNNAYKGHCLQFLDTLTYTSFSPAQFHSIAITGGAITNSYTSFLKTAPNSHTKNKYHRSQIHRSQNLDPWRLSPPKKNNYLRNSHPISFPKYWQWRSSFFPTHNRFAFSSNQQIKNNNNRLYTIDAVEKLVVFDRPFFWFVQGAL